MLENPGFRGRNSFWHPYLPPALPLQIGCRFLVSWQPTSPSPLSIPLRHPLIPPSPSPLAPTPPRLPRLTLHMKSGNPPRCVATRKDSVFTAFVSRRCRSYPISCGNLPRNSGQESCCAAFRVVLGDFVLQMPYFLLRSCSVGAL